MPVNRKKRRADGTLRPAIVRRRARKNRERNAARDAERDAQPERQAWLANFEPGERERFFNHVVLKDAVFLAAFEETTGLARPEAAALLERTAAERHWRKLRTLDGTVVGIAPPRKTRTRKKAASPA